MDERDVASVGCSRRFGWFQRATCETHDMRGRRRRFNRLVPEGQNFKSWIVTALPPVFHGCTVHFTTPLHHNIGVVDPDSREWEWVG